jgi:C1A family cysteine protease
MTTYKFLIILALACCVYANRKLTYSDYVDYLLEFDKFEERTIDSKEFFTRFNVFKNNIWNLSKKKNPYYKSGVTKYSDWTAEELKSLGGLKPGFATRLAPATNFTSKRQTPPSSYDWRDYSKVTSVKDQGNCGSCYAFTAAAAVESMVLIDSSTTYDLSEQQIIDCSDGYQNDGCNGGFPWEAVNYYRDDGAQSESSYPYIESDGISCGYDSNDVVVTPTGYNVVTNSESSLQMAVWTIGPIMIAIESTGLAYYTSDVFDCGSGPFAPDHTVLIIGWGTDSTYGDFWWAKNSWGNNWGYGGYFKLKRGTMACGMEAFTYPTLSKKK